MAAPGAARPRGRRQDPGLFGYGGIARQVALRARALGMKVASCDPYVAAGDPAWQGTARHENLQGLLEACDLLSLHVPLADGTRNLIDAKALAADRKSTRLNSSP